MPLGITVFSVQPEDRDQWLVSSTNRFKNTTSAAPPAMRHGNGQNHGPILHSRFHEVWSLRKGTSLEDRPRYTATTTFETFPFPEGLSPDVPASDYATDPRAQAIASAARRLVELRDRWLNPPEWVEWVQEPVPGYPRRTVPRDGKAAEALKKRTLTNLYNARPQWLTDAHARLDAAVAAAYGCPAAVADDAALADLLARNGGLAGSWSTETGTGGRPLACSPVLRSSTRPPVSVRSSRGRTVGGILSATSKPHCAGVAPKPPKGRLARPRTG